MFLELLGTLKTELQQTNLNNNEKAEVYHLLADLQSRLHLEANRSAQIASNQAEEHNIFSDLGDAFIFQGGDEVDLSDIPGAKTKNEDALEALREGTQVFKTPKDALKHQVNKLVEASRLLFESLENYEKAINLYPQSSANRITLERSKSNLEKTATPFIESAAIEILDNGGLVWGTYTPRSEIIEFYEKCLPFVKEKIVPRRKEINELIAQAFNPQSDSTERVYLKDGIRYTLAKLLFDEATVDPQRTKTPEFKREKLAQAKQHIDKAKIRSPNNYLINQIGSWIDEFTNRLAN